MGVNRGTGGTKDSSQKTSSLIQDAGKVEQKQQELDRAFAEFEQVAKNLEAKMFLE